MAAKKQELINLLSLPLLKFQPPCSVMGRCAKDTFKYVYGFQELGKINVFLYPDDLEIDGDYHWAKIYTDEYDKKHPICSSTTRKRNRTKSLDIDTCNSKSIPKRTRKSATPRQARKKEININYYKYPFAIYCIGELGRYWNY